MAPRAQSGLRRIADAYLQACAHADPEAWLELLADDVVIVSDRGTHQGPDRARHHADRLEPRAGRVVAETDDTVVIELDGGALHVLQLRDERIAEVRMWSRTPAPAADPAASAEQRITALVAQGVSSDEVVAAVHDEVHRLGAAASTLIRLDSDAPTDPALAALRDDGRVTRLSPGDDLTRHLGTHHAIAFPIHVDGATRAVHLVGSREPLDLATQARIAGLADLISTAMSNTAARDELRYLAEEQRALRRVATLVARGTSQREIFEAVAVEASRVMGGDATALFRYDPDGGATVVAVCGLPVSLGTTVAPNAEGVVGEVHRTGRPARLDAYAADAVRGPAADRARRIGVRGAVGVPVVVAGRTWGVLTATSWSLPLPPGTEERGAQFSDLVSTAISNAENRAELTTSRARVVAAGDESRRRILRDLHDGAQQRLVHAIIVLKEAQRAYGPDGVPLIDEALQQAETTMAELRDLVHGIMPLALTQGGLAAGIRSLVEPLSLPVDIAVSSERLPELVETTAYLIVAEALTNTVKHAGASGARVAGSVADGALNLEVSDDGAGGAARAAQGTGIVGLVDRVGAIGGTLTITSPPGHGTTLHARLPLRPDLDAI